jgi:hypothetical protein
MVRYTTGATSGGETAYPAGAPELTPATRVLLDLLVFCVVFCRSLFVLFLLVIVLSVLRFTYSDYSVHAFVHLIGCTLVCVLVLRFPSVCIHISHITRTSLHDLGISLTQTTAKVNPFNITIMKWQYLWLHKRLYLNNYRLNRSAMHRKYASLNCVIIISRSLFVSSLPLH